MEITGKLVQFLPEQRGETQRGPWVRGGFVIETEEQYARKIAFSVWGEDKWNAIRNLPLGNTIKVTFSIESREFNERWYTDCRCSQVDVFTAATPQTPYNSAYSNQAYGQSYQANNQNNPTAAQGYPSNNPNNPAQESYKQPPAQMPTPEQQMPQNTQGGGTIEQEGMAAEGDDDLPF